MIPKTTIDTIVKTQRDYYDYSGTDAVEAEILEIRSRAECIYAILLDKTIFYPEGGGQPGDRGFINGLPLLDVIEERGEILHLISIKKEDHSPEKEALKCLEPGKAELLLDWRRRRDFSATHTGQHLLSGILFHKYKIPTKSVHLGEEICLIDIECPVIEEDKLLEIEDAVIDAIEKKLPVIVHLCPPEDPSSFPLRKPPPKGEEQIRIMEIQGLDFSPCCGTHLNSTGEIGMLRILGAEKYKGMTRLSFIVGRRCLYDSRLLRKNAEIVSRALSVPIGEIGKGVLDFVERTTALEEQLKVYKDESNRAKTEELAKKTGPLIIESYKADMDEVLNIGKMAQKLIPAILILVSQNENKFAAFSGQKGLDIRPLFKDKLENFGGKGGGGPSFFQGSFSSASNLEEFIEEIRKNEESL